MLFYTVNFQVTHLRCVFSNFIYIFYTVNSPFFWILPLFFECWYYALYVNIRVLLFCVCLRYSLIICVIQWMFILFSECCNSRKVVVSWRFCYCHVFLLYCKSFYSLHICGFLGMIVLFSGCWYSPSIAAVLWMSVFCEYLCYSLKFVLLSECYCFSLNVCVVVLPSVKAYIISKSDFLSRVCQY
jgi:hypothetical protein